MVHNRKTDKDRLTRLGGVLKRGSSAIIVVFEEVIVDKTKTKEIKVKLTEEMVLTELAANIRLLLDKGKDVAYALTVDEEGIKSVRMVSDEKAANIESMLVTEEGVAGGRAAVTEEGIVYEVAAVTEEKATYKAGTVDAEGHHETIHDTEF